MRQNKDYITWEQINKFAFEEFVQDGFLRKFEYVYGIPRGGMPLAIMLSHALNLKLTFSILDKTITLIVDDVADTGKTLKQFSTKGFTIVTFAWHKKSTVKPYRHSYNKKDNWLVFPWEERY